VEATALKGCLTVCLLGLGGAEVAPALFEGVGTSLPPDRILAPKTLSRGVTWLLGWVGSLSSSVAGPDSSSSPL